MAVDRKLPPRFNHVENALSSAVPVSTLTQLMPWTSFGIYPKSALFVFVNLDAVNPVTVLLETSEDEVHIDTASALEFAVPAAEQRSYDLPPLNQHGNWRLSAYTASPAFPTVNVKWLFRIANPAILSGTP